MPETPCESLGLVRMLERHLAVAAERLLALAARVAALEALVAELRDPKREAGCAARRP